MIASALRSMVAYPLTRLQMMRVGRGFTVHSPFGYYFIRFVLRERCQFYCFRREVTSRADRRLFRVMNYFNPQTIAMTGSCDSAAAIARRVCPRATLTERPDGADFVYVGPGGEIPAEFKVLYIEKCECKPERAMTFTNGTTLIAVRRRGLPAQSFRLRF